MSYTILKRHICVQAEIIEIIVEHGNNGGGVTMAIEIKEYDGFKPKKSRQTSKPAKDKSAVTKPKKNK